MDKNGYIGKNMGLPWGEIEEEQRLFYELTRNAAIIFGSNTAKTIGHSVDKKSRDIICLTRNPVEKRKMDKFESVDYFTSNLVDATKVTNKSRIIVGGGESIFRDLLQFTDVIHATIILDECGGDKRFCQHVSPFVLDETKEIKTLEDNPNLVYNRYKKNTEGDVITLY